MNSTFTSRNIKAMYMYFYFSNIFNAGFLLVTGYFYRVVLLLLLKQVSTSSSMRPG